jgi:DNA-binding transcriptional regulator LsrR (DeoR family)
VAHSSPPEAPTQGGFGRFSPRAMFEAASMYYLGEATQAGVARALGMSRTTVSRLLSEARRCGIVRIEVVPPAGDDDDVACRLAQRLGLRAVHLGSPGHVGTGSPLGRALAAALAGVGLAPQDVLLVSCSRTLYEAAQGELPTLSRVRVVPMVGGQEEPEAWCHTNEITRQVAAKVGGHPVFLHAPALPSPELRERLVEDPATRQVLELWACARCAVVGVGAPPRARGSLPSFVARDPGLLRHAVGDVCYHFYSLDGGRVPFPGCERLMAIGEQALRALPTSIGVAAGFDKVPSIIGAARAGYLTDLVTDGATAAALLLELDDLPPRRSRARRARE